MKVLTAIWEKSKDPWWDYDVICEVIDSLDDSNDHADAMQQSTDDDKKANEGGIDPADSCKKVFYHTIYRYMVMFAGSSILVGVEGDCWVDNIVYKTITEALGISGNVPITKRGDKFNCRTQYEEDVQQWSLETGIKMERYAYLLTHTL